jgi:hypothetical protein
MASSQIFPAADSAVSFISLNADSNQGQRHVLVGWQLDGEKSSPILYPKQQKGTRLIAEFQNGYCDHETGRTFQTISELRETLAW